MSKSILKVTKKKDKDGNVVAIYYAFRRDYPDHIAAKVFGDNQRHQYTQAIQASSEDEAKAIATLMNTVFDKTVEAFTEKPFTPDWSKVVEFYPDAIKQKKIPKPTPTEKTPDIALEAEPDYTTNQPFLSTESLMVGQSSLSVGSMSPDNPYSLSNLLERYIKENDTAWTSPETKRKNRKYLRTLLEVTEPGILVSAFNMQATAKAAAKAIQDLSHVNEGSYHSYKTQISAFLNWCTELDNSPLQVNHFNNKKLKKWQLLQDKRPTHTISKHFDPSKGLDVRLFETDLFQNGDYIYPFQYHTWLLGWWLGTRSAELANARLSDFYYDRRHDCHWWQITAYDDAGNKIDGASTKSDISERSLPLPDVWLHELGGLRWIENLRKAGHTHLFPEFHLRKKKSSKTGLMSVIHTDWMIKEGLYIKRRLTFKSIRSTCETAYADAGVEHASYSQILGHEYRTGAQKHYIKLKKPYQLQEAVNTLKLPVAIQPYKWVDGGFDYHNTKLSKDIYKKDLEAMNKVKWEDNRWKYIWKNIDD